MAQGVMLLTSLIAQLNDLCEAPRVLCRSHVGCGSGLRAA